MSTLALPSPLIVFGDLETTGLSPTRHEAWEIGFVVRDPALGRAGDVEHLWQLRPRRLRDAEQEALSVGRFGTRFRVPRGADAADMRGEPRPMSGDQLRAEVTRVLDGAVLAANNAQFDAGFLCALLGVDGVDVPWHYRPIEVIALAAGYLAGRDGAAVPVPMSSRDVGAALGIEQPPPGQAHSALPDARWMRDLYDAVTSRTPQRRRDSITQEPNHAS